MKKPWIKVCVLVGVFLVALVFFSFFTNHENEDLTASMKEATLPVVSFSYKDAQINELHGYKVEMEPTAMRDAITPIESTRVLPVHIATYGSKIEQISYELRSMDGQRLLADGIVDDYKQNSQKIDTSIKVQNLLDEDHEYIMRLCLTVNGEKIYYYTRIMETDKFNITECLNFAQTFHESTFNEEGTTFIPTYMDAATGDATTLNYVDLSCTLKQIRWNQFSGTILGTPSVSIKEINGMYSGIIYQYVMTSTNAAGETEYYDIEEYYRLRYTSTRMYVLDFERRMNQIFTGENDFIYNGSDILLGIRDNNIEYLSTEAGDVVAFAQEGELWLYNVNNGEIQRVFSFRTLEGMDSRDNWRQHDIKIARVDEAGSVDFMVYGYMNRGAHEGEVGIGVYHYDGIAHTVEEEAFLPYTKSYEVLKAEMGQLLYQNDLGIVYLMLEGNVYSFNINTLSMELEIPNLSNGTYAVSNGYIAWVDGDKPYASTEINVKNLANGSSFKINKDDSTYLLPLGFIGKDFIYGIASKDDVTVDAAGNTSFLMNSIEIMNTSEDSQEILKTYSADGKYITGIQVEDYVISISLVTKNADGTNTLSTDSIRNSDAGTSEVIGIGTVVTDVKETQMRISLKKTTKKDSIKMITSSMIMQNSPREVEFGSQKDQERFYVYEKGNVILATDRISDAILCANENNGVVVDNKQQYIWMKAKNSTTKAFKNITPNASDAQASSIVQCVSAILEYKSIGMNVEAQVEAGATPKEILETTLQDSVVLDLTGTTVNEVLYYISNGNPVFAMTGSNSAVLLVGYTSSTVSYYDPATKNVATMSLNDANKWFSGAGNVFFSYLDE